MPQIPQTSQKTTPKSASPVVPATSSATPTPTKKSIPFKVLIALVVVIVIFGIGFLTVKISQNFPAISDRISTAFVSLSSSFTKKEKLILTAERGVVVAGEVFTISWNHENADASGSYVLSYECGSGAKLQTTDKSASMVTAGKSISCDEHITIATTTGRGSSSFIAYSPASRFSTLTLNLGFTPASTTRASVESSISLIVENKAMSTTTATSSSNPDATIGSEIASAMEPEATPPVTNDAQDTYQTTVQPVEPQPISYPIVELPIAPHYTGPADLVVRILDIGTIDKLTNAYTPTTTLKSSDRIGVRFEIGNEGGERVSNWYFNAVLPTFPSYTYSSSGQSALNSGERTEFTLGFDMIAQGGDHMVVINVDPANTNQESNETNNIAKVKIENVVF
jgi:hypothetical protein